MAGNLLGMRGKLFALVVNLEAAELAALNPIQHAVFVDVVAALIVHFVTLVSWSNPHGDKQDDKQRQNDCHGCEVFAVFDFVVTHVGSPFRVWLFCCVAESIDQQPRIGNYFLQDFADYRQTVNEVRRVRTRP